MTATKLRQKRREFIRYAALCTGLLTVPTGQSKAKQASQVWSFSACDNHQGQHFLAAWPEMHAELGFKIPVPERAHSATVIPHRNEVLFFSRRPGTKIYVVDYDRQVLKKTIEAKAGHHFYGHGSFKSLEGLFFATENPFYLSDQQGSEGVIGVYDSGTYQRIGELPSGGLGPHQLCLMPDQKTLAIANGGIFTHPSRPREKLNLDSMSSSLAYVDIASGTTLDHYRPKDPQLSLRHLACSPSGQVIVGAQYQGPAHQTQPLIFSHQGENALQAMTASHKLWQSQLQYIASIVIDHTGNTALSTAPRGGVVDQWDLTNNQHIRQERIKDAAGASYDQQQQRFLLSNGRGQVIGWQDNNIRSLRKEDYRWDNHLHTQMIAL